MRAKGRKGGGLGQTISLPLPAMNEFLGILRYGAARVATATFDVGRRSGTFAIGAAIITAFTSHAFARRVFTLFVLVSHELPPQVRPQNRNNLYQ
jgi:hypothetical protein